jgi:hypothetical protein
MKFLQSVWYLVSLDDNLEPAPAIQLSLAVTVLTGEERRLPDSVEHQGEQKGLEEFEKASESSDPRRQKEIRTEIHQHLQV